MGEKKHTEAGGKLVQREVPVAIGVEGVKDVVQLLRTEGESAVQPLFNETQNAAAEAKKQSLQDINQSVAITTAAAAPRCTVTNARPIEAAARRYF